MQRVVVRGVGRREESGVDSVPSALWAAIEDAHVVPSACSRVVVLLARADEEERPDWGDVPGVTVRAHGDSGPVFTAAATCLREDRPALVVVHDGTAGVAVALALETAAAEHYGPLCEDAGERAAQLCALRPRDRTSAPDATAAGTVPLLLSGRTEAGLRAHAGRLAAHLQERADISVADAAFTQATARTLWPHRAMVAAPGRDAVVAALRAVAEGRPGDAAVRAGSGGPQSPVFVFPGQGAQWVGMARELAATAPVFRDKLAECARELRPFVDFELDDVLSGALPLERVEVIQPALFAVMVSLAELWRSNGVTPAAVVGHSFGEIAAVTAAGALTVADGARLVAAVSRALARLQGNGEMVAVALPAAQVTALVAEWGLDLDIAVVNGPGSTVVAGTTESAAALLERLRATDVRAALLPIGIAGHSWRMEPAHEYLVREAAAVRPRATGIPVYTSTTTEPLDTGSLDAEHWFLSLREPARFQQVVEELLGRGHRVFVEMSPHPVLTLPIEETAAHLGHDVAVLDTMRRDDAGRDRYLRALAEAHLHGAAPDWSSVLPGARRVTLPCYRLDLDAADAAGGGAGPGSGLRERLLGCTPAQRVDEAIRLVTDAVAAQIEPSATAIDADEAFRSLGVDSAGALRIRNRIVEVTGLRLPVTTLFDHPTPRALAQELVRAVLGGDAPAPAPAATAPADPDEPLAIVGMACRLPGGVRSPDALWQLVREGRDAVAAFPPDRGWDLTALYDADASRPGTSYQREAALLDGVAEFDAAFFGVSSREARAMDPQQRLLLETSWEALERGGIDGAALRGSRTGVFTGVMSLPYGRPLHQARPDLEGYVMTGTASSVVSGRLSYVLGLEGPALTLDTACSSSLVALHLAGQSLRRGESDLALVGGATVMAEPGLFIEFSRLRALAPDGRSKPFSADADGFGMAEGVAVLVVERLSDARRLGHDVLAVVRGSAVNQDGASNGLTAPSGPAQQRVIRAALDSAGLRAADIDVVEAHGTGTRLGDPIEAQALIAAYGSGRPAGRPLYIGSLKSNLGHTQAAAGVAGVVKMVQALRHGVMPRSLYADHPATDVEWSSGMVEPLAEERAWERADGRPRRAGVSAFGISGTNAHIILEECAPETPGTSEGAGPAAGWAEVAVPLVLSGKTPDAVRGQARALREHLASHPDLPLAHVARELATRRTAFEHRAAVTGDREEVLAALADVSPVPAGSGRVAAVFSGQGSQRTGMGRQLAQEFPVFEEALAEVCGHLDPLLGRGLREVMWSDDPELLGRTEFAQPALFAFEVALARLWRSWGVSFTAVVGHSVGEIAAAAVAGVLTVADAARLVVARGRLMQSLPGGGTMLAVAAGEEEVAATLGDPALVAIAAVNGPAAVVVSGAREEVARVGRTWRARGRRVAGLRVDHAFHSPLMEPILDEFRSVVEELRFRPPTVPLTATADTAHPVGTAAYWVEHVRRAVRFGDAVGQLADADVLIEVGPDAALAPLVETGHPVLASARRDRCETRTVLTALGLAHAHGAHVDWAALLPPAPRADLPTYAFQRQRYWDSASDAAAGAAGADPQPHPMLTSRTDLPGDGGLLLSGRPAPGSDPWLSHHVVMGTVLLPGTGFVELALEAARAAGAGSVDELVLRAPMVFADGKPRDLQVWVGPGRNTERELQIRTREAGGDWTLHATGLLAARTAGTAGFGEGDWTGGVWPPAGARQLVGRSFYEELAARGYEYGPAFRGTKALWQRDGDLFAEVMLPERQPRGFGIHPALLDAALHALPITGSLYEAGEVRLPFSFSSVSLFSSDARRLRVRIRADADSAAVWIADDTGSPVLAMEGLVLRSIERAQLEAAGATGRTGWFSETWRRRAPAATADRVPGNWLLLGEVPPALRSLFDDPLTAASWDRSTAPDGVLVGAGAAEDLLAALHEVAGHPTGPVWCVTSGAVGVGTPDDPAAKVRAAGAWGLGRVAGLELPDRWGGLVDLPEPIDDAAREVLAGILTGGATSPGADGQGTDGQGAEDQLAVREGRLWARRLVTAPAPAPGTGAWTPKGTVLITGGTGGLGGHVARRIAGQGSADRILLLSRQGPSAPGAAELLAELSAFGAEAEAVAVDVTDRAAMSGLIGALAAEGAPVRTVVHAAGVVRALRIAKTGAEELAAQMAAKVEGALLLDELLPELDDFVLFSSISGIWGAADQAGYAAGNACLDALARRRREQGKRAVSLAWGPWAGGGMLTERDERELRKRGLTPLPVPAALQAMEQGIMSDRTGDPVVADIAWSRFLPAFTASRPSPLLGSFQEAAAPEHTSPPDGPRTEGVAQRLAALPVPERLPALTEVVQTHVAALIGESGPERVRPHRALKEIGFDSLMSVELRNRFADLIGVRLPATLVFDHPTPNALAQHLLGHLDLGAAGAAPVEKPLLEVVEDLRDRVLSPLTDAATRRALTGRLAELLDRLAALDARPVAEADGLASASAAELMQFIDTELGDI
ncbi:SDR family NAD(P)-dependent oxidoreductase [Streptomyces pacificus]|uniref:SDR family NAD(P)-dependent oxidoreductase n=2 Tax=Streptomyces pacificus TaxID=2705029 RepID=A0A6A0APA9_9ACTN|nr:SDR family NAD(P)-dependent oxidoreductase [Streptomyces pacificus]